MKHLVKGATGQRLTTSSPSPLLFPALGLLGSTLVLGCSREAIDSLRAAPPSASEQIAVPEPIPPQQTVGGPADLFVHRSTEGESETRVLPPSESSASAPRGLPTADAHGPTLGEIAPTIIAAARPVHSQPTAETVRWVDLTLPVSLPQTGPEGTVMSFGVEYRLLAEAPRDQTYAWMIQSRTGRVFRLDGLQLDRQGNLLTIVAEWRPEDGPFCTWIEDAMRRQVSQKLDF